MIFLQICILNCNNYIEIERLIYSEKESLDLVIKFKDGSYIKRAKNKKEIILQFASGYNTILENNFDFSHLLLKSKESNKNCLTNYCSDKNDSLEEFLNFNLMNYYFNFKSLPMFGGNPRAKNSYSSSQFNYQLINQTQSEGYAIEALKIWKKLKNKNLKELPFKAQKHWDNLGVRGMECQGASFSHQLKSLGLIRPDFNREEIEERYTELHSTSNNLSKARIPSKFNKVLRFKKTNFSKNDIIEIIRILQNTDWAKLTGSIQKKFILRELKSSTNNESIEELKKIIEAGWIINSKQVAFSHNVCIKDYSKGIILTDDSYAMQNKKDSESNLKKYFNFWYLETYK
jgi:hypothetical protein